MLLFNRLINAPLSRGMIAAALAVLLAGCANQPATPEPKESLNATLWVQTSAEYSASTLQAYQLAVANLDRALADPQWTAVLERSVDDPALPPAVMLDLDQTVLDTGSYNARLLLQDGSYAGSSFADWCRQVTAPAIPGVQEFVGHAVKRGITVIYNSARSEELRDCTARNLLALGLPLPGQQQLLLSDGTAATGKAQHRSSVASQYRVLLLVGDNLNDFVSGTKTGPASRRAMAAQYAARWGREWIMLPNPIYGSWEYSLYDFEYTLPRDERLSRKLQHLQQ
jgi:5'-nucleotidase (lipoprotein e(P4) family)